VRVYFTTVRVGRILDARDDFRFEELTLFHEFFHAFRIRIRGS